MNFSQLEYRELFYAIHAKDDRPAYEHVLLPWVESHDSQRHWLHSFSLCGASSVPAVDVEDLWQLYAVSRVNELLLLSFQEGRSYASGWFEPKVSLEEYVSFSELFGFRIEDVPLFSPFHHEIVNVDQADNEDEPMVLQEILWPCLMLGSMMFSRAGVRISCGKNLCRKEIAETSTLYWTYRRKNRPYRDISHGWGSNSQCGPSSVGTTSLVANSTITSMASKSSTRQNRLLKIATA